MRIALVGNMNNNNFAIMRYLRDLGEDAHLFPFKDEHEHFYPENDTWSYEAWCPFIHYLNFANSQYELIRKSGRDIGKHFRGYDTFIGCGLSPALLAKANIHLDIFYNYAIGVEFVGEEWIIDTVKNGTLKRRLFYRYVQAKQISAIAKARFCTNAAIDSSTENVFRSRIGRDFEPLALPMVYNREEITPDPLPTHLADLKERFGKHSPVVLSHARHWWHPSQFEKSSIDFQRLHNKHNHWLIEGFAKFVAQHPKENPLLVLFEYGSDVEHSKQLVESLGVGNCVLWVPRSSRKEIMYLLSLSDIGVGEFPSKGIWGGTGWETLAAGKPLLQSVNYKPMEFRQLFGHDLPPILDVKSPDDIERHLSEYVQGPPRFAEIGIKSRQWFNQNNGIELAKRYLELLRS